MRSMLRRSARRSGGRRCALLLSRAPSNNRFLCCTWKRELLVRQRTMLVNSLRSQKADWAGRRARDGKGERPCRTHPSDTVVLFAGYGESLRGTVDDAGRQLQQQIHALERSIMACHRTSAVSQQLETIPSVGVITATAIAATVADAKVFASGRHFAARIGLTPRQTGTGDKIHLGKISK